MLKSYFLVVGDDVDLFDCSFIDNEEGAVRQMCDEGCPEGEKGH